MKTLTQTFEEILGTTPPPLGETFISKLIQAVREYNKEVVGNDVEEGNNFGYEANPYVEQAIGRNQEKEAIRQRQEELL